VLDDETRKVIYAAVISAAGLCIEAEMIPPGSDSARIALWAVKRGGDKVIIQDADAKVDMNVHRRSPWGAVAAAAAMEVNKIYGERVTARPEHLQGATKAKRLNACSKVTAGALNAGTNDTRE